MKHFFSRKGFTLMEIMIGTTILVVLTSVVIITANPFGQIATARNKQRELHLEALMNSIRQNIADTTTGSFTCAAGAVPTSTRRMSSATSGYNIAGCLVPTYMLTLPFDSNLSGAYYNSNTDYDSGYDIMRNASTSQITLSAPGAELDKVISLTR